ncbi:unnamed protein product [Zymoseptoria tritici ST99CH_3D1]|nr:unnamed protein product [Zymoseptoria tritici ST99CH_3D1]
MQIFQLSVLLALASTVAGLQCYMCFNDESCKAYPKGGCGNDDGSGVVACNNQCPGPVDTGHPCSYDGKGGANCIL